MAETQDVNRATLEQCDFFRRMQEETGSAITPNAATPADFNCDHYSSTAATTDCLWRAYQNLLDILSEGEEKPTSLIDKALRQLGWTPPPPPHDFVKKVVALFYPRLKIFEGNQSPEVQLSAAFTSALIYTMCIHPKTPKIRYRIFGNTAVAMTLPK